MEKDIYFENIPEIGTLYLELILLSFDNEPILFVCTNEDMKLYLCLCSEIRGMQKWIISPTSIKILNDLFEKKIDIYSALENQNNYKIIIELDLENNFSYKKVLFTDIDSLDLPKKDTYLKYLDKERAIDFIKNIDKQKSNDVIEYFIVDLKNTIGSAFIKHKYVEEKYDLQIHFSSCNLSNNGLKLKEIFYNAFKELYVKEFSYEKMNFKIILNSKCEFNNFKYNLEALGSNCPQKAEINYDNITAA